MKSGSTLGASVSARSRQRRSAKLASNRCSPMDKERSSGRGIFGTPKLGSLLHVYPSLHGCGRSRHTRQRRDAGNREHRGHFQLFSVPIVFLLGRYDWHVPSFRAERYFDAVTAPCKRLIWFEQSAHKPPFEEPQKLVRVVADEVLAMAAGPSSACMESESPTKHSSQPATLAAELSRWASKKSPNG